MLRLDLLERKAGEFIDLDNAFREVIDITQEIDIENTEDNAEYLEKISKFYILLLGELPKNSECEEAINVFVKEITEIKENFFWIYNPPPMPSDPNAQQPTAGDGLRQEFAEDYGGYIELVYLLCQGDMTKVPKVMEMKTQDFLFWGEYLLRKKRIENVK